MKEIFDVLFWIICFGISIVAGIIAWKTFPYFISRRDRYRKSEYELKRERFIKSVAVAGVVIVWGFVIWFVAKDHYF
ncbi:hypothetical protein [Bacteroides reticulotermitis]|uniref:hypothetical protein n=1 Tax=Bacteroides reticulotermitis TaxID=1133319 RepID=UPI003A8B11C5